MGDANSIFVPFLQVSKRHINHSGIFFFLMSKIVYFLDTNLCPNSYYEIQNRIGVIMGFINCNKTRHQYNLFS